MTRLSGELQRLTGASAAGGALPAIITAIREREARRTILERQRAKRAQGEAALPHAHSEVERQLNQQVADWRRMLGEETAWTRQIVQKLLV